MKTNKRRKTLVAALLAMMMAVPIGIRAQTDGFLGNWDSGDRGGSPTLDNQGFGANNMGLDNQGFGVNNMGLGNQGFGLNNMGLGNQGFGLNNMGLGNQGFGVNDMGLDNQGFGVNDMGLTNQTFGEAPLGSGLLILAASAAGYAVLKKKRDKI